MRTSPDPQPLLISSSPRFEPRAVSLSEREPWEKMAILEFHRDHPLKGRGRLAFMMRDGLGGGWGNVAPTPRAPPQEPRPKGAALHRPVFCFGIDTKAVNRVVCSPKSGPAEMGVSR